MDLIPHVFEAVLAFVGLRVVINQANQITGKNSKPEERPILPALKEPKLIAQQPEELKTIDVSSKPVLPPEVQSIQAQKQLESKSEVTSRKSEDKQPFNMEHLIKKLLTPVLGLIALLAAPTQFSYYVFLGVIALMVAFILPDKSIGGIEIRISVLFLLFAATYALFCIKPSIKSNIESQPKVEQQKSPTPRKTS